MLDIDAALDAWFAGDVDWRKSDEAGKTLFRRDMLRALRAAEVTYENVLAEAALRVMALQPKYPGVGHQYVCGALDMRADAYEAILPKCENSQQHDT